MTVNNIFLEILKCRSYKSVIVALTDLVGVGNVGTAVAGVSHSISIPVQLVSVLDSLTVVQEVFQT